MTCTCHGTTRASIGSFAETIPTDISNQSQLAILHTEYTECVTSLKGLQFPQAVPWGTRKAPCSRIPHISLALPTLCVLPQNLWGNRSEIKTHSLTFGFSPLPSSRPTHQKNFPSSLSTIFICVIILHWNYKDINSYLTGYCVNENICKAFLPIQWSPNFTQTWAVPGPKSTWRLMCPNLQTHI